MCATAAVGAPLAMLTGEGREALGFGLAGLALLLCGEASWSLAALALLPFLQLLPGGSPPAELTGAMAAAGVAGPGTHAVDPTAVWPEALALAGCLAVFALARTAARLSPAAAWWALAVVAGFGCYEGALGVASGVDAAPASGTLVNRGQYAALLELTFGAGCALAAASWAGRTWRERLEERPLLGGLLGLAGVALSLAGIASSLSRTGVVAGALAAIAAALWFGRRRAWVLVLAGVLAAGLAFWAPRALDRFEQLANAGGDPGRSAVWTDSIDLAREHWLTGVGAGSFSSAFRRSSFYLPRKSIEHAHSDYLERLVELGAPAAALLCGAILWTVVRAARGPGKRPLGAGCLLGVGALLLHATVDLPLEHPGIAALAAALLGFAAPVGARHAAPGPALGLLTAALALVPVQTPQQLYRAAGKASARGDLSQAERLYRVALDRNLHTAPAWLRLSEIARSRGESDRALLFARAARTVEPFTLRTEWPLAELELESDPAAALERLSGLVATAPDLLDAALHTASRSGVDPAALQRLVPPDNPEAAGRYLAFLVRNQASDILPKAYARLGAPDLPQPYRDWLAREAGFQP